MTEIHELPPLREVIKAEGLSAKKSLGQNFLLDLNLTSKIARQAGDLRGADIIEVGPGPGGLTRGLLMEGARKVIAIERDARCKAALDPVIAASNGRLEVIYGDALEVDLAALATPPVRIVANLPYNIGTELLTRWLSPPDWPPLWQSLTLMFQKEVAERICAAPGSKAYGRLSILAQWRTEPRIVMSLPPEAFTPPPKISSSVVHLQALDAPRFPACAQMLSRVTAAAFGQRRKMLRASLKALHPQIEGLLREIDIAPTVRAEEVDLADFCAIARLLDTASARA